MFRVSEDAYTHLYHLSDNKPPFEPLGKGYLTEGIHDILETALVGATCCSDDEVSVKFVVSEQEALTMRIEADELQEPN
jgi:hypothetical protein